MLPQYQKFLPIYKVATDVRLNVKSVVSSLFDDLFQVWNRHFFVLFKNRLFWTGETKADEDDEQDQEQNWDGPLLSEVQ